ncbi:glutathione S-transferase family protein [Acinetobacter sp. S40]|uniref:glutathione S-transferase family protein n=1 Tax=unclassified Acinetobacter TaxID=196816 RepID=UPI001909BF0C|nr:MULTISPECIES: glutathione S-transferase family protein [unclassified Acinetobacter]MBJ9983937.1 glutathione S-transferase family protein [Acinetobacter sp. S40]MBK0063530.1 glutathione S-transferase family protein [Acinetobacter sp. S55]MBK0065399.1 glutathione S-transferase family protein [Acinetobacter sp. S54]
MELYIGNKNYSSWSMRPWLVMTHFNLTLDEHAVAFDDFAVEGQFKQTMSAISPAAKVPTLVDQDVVVWDSLAICEYLAESFPEKHLWPVDKTQRARARSISAEMHSSFMTLRQYCGMNIEADLRFIGSKLWNDLPALRTDVARIEQIWAERPDMNGFLCGDFSIADAFYAPVVMRFVSYGLPVSEQSQQYMQTILANAAVQQWMNQAQVEKQFVQNQEPYRQHPEQFLRV